MATPVTDGPDDPPGLVAVASRPWMWSAHVRSLLELDLPADSAVRIADRESSGGGITIAQRRNAAVRWTLLGGFAWLMFIDADIAAPADAVRRMLAVDADLVACPYVSDRPPREAVAGVVDTRPFAEDEVPDPLARHHSIQLRRVVTAGEVLEADEPIPVHLSGAGCLLIHRHVLEEMPPNPFRYREEDGLGEDDSFTLAATIGYGFSLLLVPDVEVGHVRPKALTLSSVAEEGEP